MTDFPSLLRALGAAGVEFIVVGGAAATAHGSARLTLDLDVVYRRTPENIVRVVRSLQDHHPYLRGAPPGLPFRWDADTIGHGLNFTLTTDLGPVPLARALDPGQARNRPRQGPRGARRARSNSGRAPSLTSWL